MESVYHIIAICVNETSWVHVWRLRSLYLRTGYDSGRAIHDNFRDVQLSAKLLHARCTPFVLLKLDIAKAFNTVNWAFLHALLRHLGFSHRWINWVSCL
jgi:hypothetical protein